MATLEQQKLKLTKLFTVLFVDMGNTGNYISPPTSPAPQTPLSS
jgi:hypothetical protein